MLQIEDFVGIEPGEKFKSGKLRALNLGDRFNILPISKVAGFSIQSMFLESDASEL